MPFLPSKIGANILNLPTESAYKSRSSGCITTLTLSTRGWVANVLIDLVRELCNPIFTYCFGIFAPNLVPRPAETINAAHNWDVSGHDRVALHDTAQKALSIGKSVLTGRAQGFVYPMNDAVEDETD